jgi:hypothetical protein
MNNTLRIALANKELGTFPYDKGIIIQFFKEKAKEK